MSFSAETYALSKKYTNNSISGISGSLAGKNCTIQSITEITGGQRVTFQWTADDSTTRTSVMDVMNGKGIASVAVNASNHLIITYSDGTTIDAGEIEITAAVTSVNEKTGNVVLTADDLSAYTSAETNAKIQTEIEKLDVTDSAVEGSYVTQVTETDGKIAVTREAADTTPTENSKKMAQSGGVYTDTQNVYNANGVLGAKNLLPLKLSIIKEQNTKGTWNGNVYSRDGIEFTVNSTNDLVTSIVANGTASAASQLLLSRYTQYTDNYIVNGCIGGSTSTYEIRVRSQTTGDFHCINGDILFTPDSAKQYLVEVVVANGVSVTNKTFYPMFRLATDTDPTYQPYALTNTELTMEKADNSVIAPVESGTTASQAYAVGEHFIRDSAFCTCISAIAQGGSFTLNTNYTTGNIAERIAPQDSSLAIDSSIIAASQVIKNSIKKIGHIVFFNFAASAVTIDSPWTIIGTIPDGYRPYEDTVVGGGNPTCAINVTSNGNFQFIPSIDNKNIFISGVWITNS